MLKKELDKLRDMHYQEVNSRLNMSPESMRSGKYFTTNSETDNNQKLAHEYGVLKRTPNTGSTPSFKPYPNSSKKQMSMFSTIEEKSPENDTMGNKFDELEKRLMSLENTLDGKPAENYETNRFNSSPTSYNPFSPPKDQAMLVQDNSEYIRKYKRQNDYPEDPNNSPKYIDSSVDHTEEHIVTHYSQSELRLRLTQVERLLKESESHNKILEKQLEEKSSILDQIQSDESRKNHEYEQLYHKLEKAEKANERLKTTYDVLREQEITKVREDLKTGEERQNEINDLKEKLSEKENDTKVLTERIGDLNEQLKSKTADVER